MFEGNSFLLHHYSFVFGLEPANSIIFCHLVLVTNSTRLDLASSNSVSRTNEDNEEVHTEDTGAGVILDAEVNVFVDTEAEVACYNN